MAVFGLLAAIALLGLVAAWGVRQDRKRRAAREFQRKMALIAADLRAFSATIGRAFIPATRRAAASIAALGEAIAAARIEDPSSSGEEPGPASPPHRGVGPGNPLNPERTPR